MGRPRTEYPKDQSKFLLDPELNKLIDAIVRRRRIVDPDFNRSRLIEEWGSHLGPAYASAPHALPPVVVPLSPREQRRQAMTLHNEMTAEDLKKGLIPHERRQVSRRVYRHPAGFWTYEPPEDDDACAL
jgi:hypothetical protein